MEKVDVAIYKTLRDDSEASVGIRALLGNTTTTPYNTYHAFLPDNIDFSPAAGNVGFIVYMRISSTPDLGVHSLSTLTEQSVYQISAYHRVLSSVEAIHRRIKKRLLRLDHVTQPTSQSGLYQLLLESEDPVTFDDSFKVWFQQKYYRAWVRDDDIIS